MLAPRLLSLVNTAALVVGCKGASEPPPRPRLVTDEELVQLEARLMARITAARPTACVRPVLRGEPVAGSATPKILTLIEQTGEIKSCTSALPNDDHAKVRQMIDERQPAVRELEGRCGAPLAAMIHEAVVHGDACSPYQVGHRAHGELLPALQAARLVGLHSRRLADEGKPEAALWTLLELAAFSQDMARGSSGNVVRQVSSVLPTEAGDQAMAILNMSALSPAGLDALSTGVDRLLSAMPSFSETLLSEIDTFGLQDYLPKLKPKGWIPPGGWIHGYDEHTAKSVGAPFLDPREEAGFMLVANEVQAAKFVQACPPSATVRSCHDGLAALAKTTDQSQAAVFAKVLALTNASTDEARLAVRQLLVDAIVAIAASEYQTTPVKASGLVIRFGAVRLHVEILRFVAATRRCPTLAELDAPPFEALRSPAALGDRLVIEAATDGFAIKSPAWFESKRAGHFVRCATP